MHKPVILRGPIPTPEQMAYLHGVSRERLEEIRNILEDAGLLGPRAQVTSKSRSKKPAAQAKKQERLARVNN